MLLSFEWMLHSLLSECFLARQSFVFNKRDFFSFLFYTKYISLWIYLYIYRLFWVNIALFFSPPELRFQQTLFDFNFCWNHNIYQYIYGLFWENVALFFGPPELRFRHLFFFKISRLDAFTPEKHGMNDRGPVISYLDLKGLMYDSSMCDIDRSYTMWRLHTSHTCACRGVAWLRFACHIYIR